MRKGEREGGEGRWIGAYIPMRMTDILFFSCGHIQTRSRYIQPLNKICLCSRPGGPSIGPSVSHHNHSRLGHKVVSPCPALTYSEEIDQHSTHAHTLNFTIPFNCLPTYTPNIVPFFIIAPSCINNEPNYFASFIHSFPAYPLPIPFTTSAPNSRMSSTLPSPHYLSTTAPRLSTYSSPFNPCPPCPCPCPPLTGLV